MKIALYLDNCHFKVSRSEVKRSKLRRTYVLMIAVIPPVCGGSVIRDFLRYLVSKNTKTPSNLNRSKTHEIIPAIKESDKDDSSYSLLLLSTFHRLVLIPEKFKQQQRFESSEPFYLRQRATQLARITSDFKMDVIEWIKLFQEKICIMYCHCIMILWYNAQWG